VYAPRRRLIQPGTPPVKQRIYAAAGSLESICNRFDESDRLYSIFFLDLLCSRLLHARVHKWWGYFCARRNRAKAMRLRPLFPISCGEFSSFSLGTFGGTYKHTSCLEYVSTLSFFLNPTCIHSNRSKWILLKLITRLNGQAHLSDPV